MALAVSGTRVEVREVKLSAKPEAMLRASPKGTVPVLLMPDGQVIDQSIDIMRTALRWNDPEGWLDRDDRELIESNDGRFKHALDRYKYPERHGTDALAHRASGLAFLQELEARLADACHLCGATRGLADSAILPFVRQFAAVDPAWFDTLPLPRLKAWLQANLQSDLFAMVMVRVAPWSQGNLPVFIP